MALKVAVASGNWSNSATWGGTLPMTDDIVASNTYTVTIDQNINVAKLTNSAESNYGVVPIMTSNTTPEGVAFTNNSAGSGYEPYRAFDSTTGTSYFSTSTPTVANPIHLGYEFTSAKIIVKYSYSAHANSISYSPVDFTFEGYDGTNWVVLHTVVGHNSITYTSPILSNTTAYLSYRINVTKSGSYNFEIKQLYFYIPESTGNAAQGGGFILNDGVTVTCNNGGITAGNSTCVTYTGTGTATVNSSITALSVSPGSYTYTFVHTGSGILNINGDLIASFSCSNRGCFYYNGSNTLNIVGDVYGGFCNSPNVYLGGTGTINVVGNVIGGSNVTSIYATNFVNLSIIGDLLGGSNSGRAFQADTSAVVNITGNLLKGAGSGPAISISSGSPRIIITGNIGDIADPSGSNLLTSTTGSYIKVIGTITAGTAPAFSSTSVSSTNIFTGPFISYNTGILPIFVARAFYEITSGGYFEFRDNSTNAALPPAANAPATRLVSPDTIIGGLLPSDVRQGVTYSSGSFVGTMIVPSPTQVVSGIPVDDTVGTAVLDATTIWAVPLTSINTLNSIGRRVKNAATVETTGAQIQQTINNNE